MSLSASLEGMPVPRDLPEGAEHRGPFLRIVMDPRLEPHGLGSEIRAERQGAIDGGGGVRQVAVSVLHEGEQSLRFEVSRTAPRPRA